MTDAKKLAELRARVGALADHYHDQSMSPFKRSRWPMAQEVEVQVRALLKPLKVPK